MPTSATGNKLQDARDGGFTLVELLIVLVLIGLMSAAVVLAIPDPRGTLRDEAERFAARAKAAQEQAILGASPTSVRVTGAGYGFDRRVRGQWRPLPDRVFADRSWEEGVTAAAGQQGVARIVFDTTGLAEPAEVTLERDGRRLTVTIAQDGRIDVAA